MAGIGMITSIAGTALGALGTLAQMGAAQAQSEFQQAQLKKQEQEARAIGTQRARERRREQRLAESAQIARAASVGGAGDPSVTTILAETAATGERNVQTEIALGENRAQNFALARAAEKASAKSARIAGLIGVGTDLLSSASSLAGRFGKPRQPTTGFLYG